MYQKMQKLGCLNFIKVLNCIRTYHGKQECRQLIDIKDWRPTPRVEMELMILQVDTQKYSIGSVIEVYNITNKDRLQHK
jgi:hypothetical protein